MRWRLSRCLRNVWSEKATREAWSEAECCGEFKGVVNVKWSGVGGRVVREDVGRDAVK